MDGQTEMDRHRWMDRQTDAKNDRQTDQRWMDRLTDGQTTDEWTNRDG